MPSPPTLDVESLLAPIPGDDPAGDTVPFEIREKLEDLRQEDDPRDERPDGQAPRKADWPAVISIASETLQEKSKSLLVGARLTEALAHTQGFAGVRDGLHLMRRLIEECWDRMHPTIEDGDLEIRAGIFSWLDELSRRGANYPNVIKLVPMVVGNERLFSQQDWLDLNNKEKSAALDFTIEDFEKALLQASPESIQVRYEDIEESLKELSALGAVLTQRLEKLAPSMSTVRQALEECKVTAQVLARRKGGTPAAAAAAAGAAPASAAGATPPGVGGAPMAALPSSGGSPAARAEVYQHLMRAADMLAEIEPHSPIPYLLRRAVRLGNMPFPKLLKELVRDDAILGQLNREFGLPQEEASE